MSWNSFQNETRSVERFRWLFIQMWKLQKKKIYFRRFLFQNKQGLLPEAIKSNRQFLKLWMSWISSNLSGGITPTFQIRKFQNRKIASQHDRLHGKHFHMTENSTTNIQNGKKRKQRRFIHRQIKIAIFHVLHAKKNSNKSFFHCNHQTESKPEALFYRFPRLS